MLLYALSGDRHVQAIDMLLFDVSGAPPPDDLVA